MRSLAPCLAVMLAGLCLALGAGIAVATAATARGGHATAPLRAMLGGTTKAPTPPQTVGQSRGWHGGDSSAGQIVSQPGR